MSARIVLHEADISRALTRIAHEILESNRGAEDLVLLGIPTRGVTLAHRLSRVISDIAHAPVPAGSLIRPDFVGKNIPSARQERVNVRLTEHDGAEEVTIEA